MKKRGFLSGLILALWAVLLVAPSTAQAVFDSGSTGENGPFEPTANTVLQIPESGVFNFTTVNIPSGVTVTFTKNERNTGVTMLASGNVTVNGTINLSGASGNYVIGGAGGAGGFDGGVGGVVNGNGRRGQGPGGGTGGAATSYPEGGGCAGGGGYGGSGGGGHTYRGDSPGGAGGAGYGNERLLPLLGGSGGAGGGGTNAYVGGAGGGGGGAIVIASSGTIAVNGAITANGGNGANGESIAYWWGYEVNYRGGAGGGGAGGAIRLVANTITGNGTISAAGGNGGRGWGGIAGAGSVGRVRFEAQSNLRTTGTNPPLSVGYPYAVIPPSMPSLAVTSIGGIEVPAVPKGAFGAPDVLLPFNTKNPITIVVSGVNIPTGTTVTLKATPEVGTVSTASGALAGSDASSSVSIPLNIATAYPSLITATVTFQLTAANGGPFYVNGEKVDRVRVAAVMGGASSVVYITESGKEITAKI